MYFNKDINSREEFESIDFDWLIDFEAELEKWFEKLVRLNFDFCVGNDLYKEL